MADLAPNVTGRSVTENPTVCDVLVAGSGAGGLSAAIAARAHGLDVLIAEKGTHYGGTTARSGGWLWVPDNPVSKREGIDDSVERARTYIGSEAGEFFDPEVVDAYLAYGSRMVSFFEEQTCVRFAMGDPHPDYHPEKPGAAQNGRSFIVVPFDGRELGPRLDQLNPPMHELLLWGLRISGPELQHFFNATRSLASAMFVLRHLAAHIWDVVRYGRSLRLVTGNALVARLGKSAFDRGIPLWLSSEVRELIVESGVVRGAMVTQEGKPVRVLARRGVVLACGGFPHDAGRLSRLYARRWPGVNVTLASAASPGNTGDGVRLGESVEAQFDDRPPGIAYSAPASFVPFDNGATGLFIHLFDCGKPGVIAVTRHGKRFVNESRSYHDVAQAILGAVSRDDEAAAFVICDHRAIRRYGLGFAKPFPMPLWPHLRSGYLLCSRTIEGLARKAGIDPEGLASTVAEFNHHARDGKDPHFGKGGNAYCRSHGDPRNRPNPCVAPLEQRPFYAVKVIPCALATFIGLRTNGHAQVLNKDGKPIIGLYAAGNDMASLFGGNASGAGINLGPAMTFGYIAGLHLARKI